MDTKAENNKHLAVSKFTFHTFFIASKFLFQHLPCLTYSLCFKFNSFAEAFLLFFHFQYKLTHSSMYRATLGSVWSALFLTKLLFSRLKFEWIKKT